MQASPLARILLGLYALLIVYATLHPMVGWRDSGLPPFAYLSAPWPRYVTRFDLTANILGYIPFGVLAVAAMRPWLRGVPAFALATALAFALTLTLEALQNYLPARIPSNLDVLCNVLGAAAGAALAAHFVPRLGADGPLGRGRRRVFLSGGPFDAGLALLGLWLFVQLDPSTLLFGAGDLNDYLQPRGTDAYPPQLFIVVEALTAAANLVAVGLLFSLLAAPTAPVRGMLAAFVLAALIVRVAAFAILKRTEDVLGWLTPGAQAGLAAGFVLAMVAVGLPRLARLSLAAMLLMAATVLVNLAPPNPYLVASLGIWEQGHFLNFNGLTQLVSALWPFAALGYLVVLAGRRARDSP